jgi:ACR3 family arsenite transporter
VFTGANPLVELPLGLALSDRFGVASIAIVTKTLVEVIGMVVYVRVIPRLVPTRT